MTFTFQSLSCPTLCDPVDYSTPGLSVHHQLLEIAQTHVHWVSDAIQPSHPLVVPFSSCLQFSPASGSFQMSHFFTSGGLTIGVFNFSISPSNEYSGLVSFRIDWFNLLAVQGTLKSLLQAHSSKASILQHSAFFMINSHIHIRLLKKKIQLCRYCCGILQPPMTVFGLQKLTKCIERNKNGKH